MQVVHATDTHADDIYRLIRNVEAEPEIFIKNPFELVQLLIKHGCSKVLYVDGLVVGAVLVTKDNYIDTIVSKMPRGGKALLSALPSGNYTTHTAIMNTRSNALFRSFGFKPIAIERLEGQERLLYAGVLE